MAESSFGIAGAFTVCYVFQIIDAAVQGNRQHVHRKAAYPCAYARYGGIYGPFRSSVYR